MSRSAWLCRIGLTLLTTISVGTLAAPAQAAAAGVALVVDKTKTQYKAARGKQNRVVVTRSGNVRPQRLDRQQDRPEHDRRQRHGQRLRHRWPRADTIRDYDGSGHDTVDYFAYEKPVTADADGVQGDDGMKGEKDTIKTDVEQIQGGQAGDRIYGTARRDVLFGGPGKDLISGYGGNDVLAGELGSDVLNGGAGNDSLIGDNATMGKVSADVIRGGTGRDRVFYDSYTKAVTVDLDGAKGDDGQAGEKDTVGADVEDIWSGTGNDRLTGNASANELQGGAGNDIIRGGAGNDNLNGDDGRDALLGEAGDDALSGNEGYLSNVVDTLDGGPNATAAGDSCWLEPVDRAVNCER